MSGIVRIEALEALAQLLQQRIPVLADHVCVGQAPSSEYETLPNLSIEPTKWGWEPEAAIEHATLPGNVLVWNVGQHSCACVLSIVTATIGERMAIEQKVLDLFIGSRHPLTDLPMPGVITVPVTACPQLSRFLASFELESDEWSDVLAADRRYESRITCTTIIPALTVQTPVYTIEELRLALAQIPPPANPPAAEVVTINEDGTIEAVP